MLAVPARAIWHKSAPSAVRRAFCRGDFDAGWVAWTRHLSVRKIPADRIEHLPGKMDPLSWALPEGVEYPPKPAWLDMIEGSAAERRPSGDWLEKDVLGWLGEPAGDSPSMGGALEAVACAHALSRLSTMLSAEVWWAVLDRLLSEVSDAGGIELKENALPYQLLGGELALTLAWEFPEISPCRKLKSAARRALSSGPIELLDGQGLPHGRHLSLLRPLLACWTRCWALGEQLGGGCFTAAAATQYEWLVRQALRLTRHDGTHVFSNGSAASWPSDLFRAALHFGGDDDDRAVAAAVLPPGKSAGRKSAGRKSGGRAGLPEAAVHSEWASTAVLRPSWSRSAERLTVVYAGRSVRTELGCGKDVLWSGQWELDVRLDGQAASPDAEWEQVCWVSDDDVDFLELELDFGGGLSVQRQMVMARDDRFLLLADAVLGKSPGLLEYRGRLPLCPGIALRNAQQTRECYLTGSKRRALVLPLALPEWRSDERVGRLTRTDEGLQLCQRTEGCRLYAPLFIDFDRRRHTDQLTWRQLTVAESLRNCPAEVAAGYRVAIGRRQWLIYRSLAEKANRTLLGHNLSTEMLVARFERSGEVEPLIEIE